MISSIVAEDNYMLLNKLVTSVKYINITNKVMCEHFPISILLNYVGEIISDSPLYYCMRPHPSNIFDIFESCDIVAKCLKVGYDHGAKLICPLHWLLPIALAPAHCIGAATPL